MGSYFWTTGAAEEGCVIRAVRLTMDAHGGRGVRLVPPQAPGR